MSARAALGPAAVLLLCMLGCSEQRPGSRIALRPGRTLRTMIFLPSVGMDGVYSSATTGETSGSFTVRGKEYVARVSPAGELKTEAKTHSGTEAEGVVNLVEEYRGVDTSGANASYLVTVGVPPVTYSFGIRAYIPNDRGAAPTFVRSAREWREGEVPVEGRSLRIVVVDANCDGSFEDVSNSILGVDRDYDGSIDGELGSGEWFHASEPITDGRGAYRAMAMADDGSWIDIVRVGDAPATPFLGAGDRAPPLPDKDLEGKRLALSEYSGRKLAVVFWASWCGNCLAQHEALAAKLSSGFELDGVDLVGVSLDDNVDDAREAAAEDPLRIRSGCDGLGWASPVAVAYQIRSLPAVVIVGADGRILRRRVLLDELAVKR